MNIVLITGKRSMRNLDTVLKKSEQAVTVGKYTSVTLLRKQNKRQSRTFTLFFFTVSYRYYGG